MIRVRTMSCVANLRIFFVACLCAGFPPIIRSGFAAENGAPLATQIPTVDFATDIRPLLSDRCFACHGPDEEHREAELRFDLQDNLTADRGGYQIIQPGDASNSEMIRRVTSEDPDVIMPPPEFGKPLTLAEQQRLREWVEQGAVWKQHWAYEAPRPAKIPESNELRNVGEHWIDRFIAAKHVPAGARFSDPADRVTLARRLSFDLTGLPPSEADVRRLSSDATPRAIDRYVEKLLSSPAFGERLAMYWLDLVRYADTVGYHGDQDHSISPYRDYVIHAFNDDKPFDEFTIEQLAGDLLDRPSEEQIVATGYNRLLQTSHEGGVQPKEYLAIYQADRVRNLSAVWFGATIGCAQCHDHKYDPFTSTDFYALAAFFADVDEAQHFTLGSNDLPTKRPPEIDVLSRSQKLLLARYESKLAREKEQLDAPSATSSEAAWRTQSIEELEMKISQLQGAARRTMITTAIAPREVRFLPRGNWLDESGPLMRPAVPAFLGSLTRGGRDAPSTTAPQTAQPNLANRLELARWLTDAQDGIGLQTARVFVNRLWLLMFGTGLSPSVEDFGGQGEPPTHPELLDQLAIEFVESGWDVKHILRLITASSTYRQSSLETAWHRSHDPLNRLYSRQNRFRLPAETVRDTALAVTDLLVRGTGGASVRPYQPAGYYRHLNFPTRDYEPSIDDNQWRRGLYVHWQRQFLHPMLQAFDAPSREECTAQRPQSNTPLAALVWLNDPSFVEAARALALQCLTERPADDTELLRRMFSASTSRDADDDELRVLGELLTKARKYFAENRPAAEELLNVGLLSRSSPVDACELAAWTTAARAVLNLNEVYTRN